MITKGVFVLGVSVFALGSVTVAATAAEVFTLKSATFADGKIMPKKVANSTANINNPNASARTSRRNCPGATRAPRASRS